MIHGERYRLKPRDVLIDRRSVRGTMSSLLDGADSPWWFWILRRPVADAVADAVIELHGMKGFRSGSSLVKALRARYH